MSLGSDFRNAPFTVPWDCGAGGLAVSCASRTVPFGTRLSTSADPELAVECLLRMAKGVHASCCRTRGRCRRWPGA